MQFRTGRNAESPQCQMTFWPEYRSSGMPTFPENFMQILQKFLRKVANGQTDKQTIITLNNFLGGGN